MGSSSFATVSAGADDGRSVDASAIGLCGGVLGEVGSCSGCASIGASPWSIVAEVSLKGGSSCLLTFPGPPLGEAWFTGKLCSLLPFSISSRFQLLARLVQRPSYALASFQTRFYHRQQKVNLFCLAMQFDKVAVLVLQK